MAAQRESIVLGHGSGGSLSAELLQTVIFPAFSDVQKTDGAVIEVPGDMRLVFTTDTYVVDPPFFPGGDVGKLAVNGTINDLAMMGARPGYISCGFVIEEGFRIRDLAAICGSMSCAAREAGVKIITGDTKVVGRGEADGIFVNTSGVGFASSEYIFSPSNVRPGDAVIVNGGIGEHGVAVMAERLGVSFDPPLMTDSMSLWEPVSALLEASILPRVMRDITRGGLASILCELASGLDVDYYIEESAIPIDPRVRRACDIWGFDPLYVACEGRFVLVVGSEDAGRAVDILRQARGGTDAAIIGEVARGSGSVTLITAIGGKRIVRPQRGELLPRIC